MRSGRSLTVRRSLLPGGVSLAGGSPWQGGLLGGGLLGRGISWQGGLLGRGVSLAGGSPWQGGLLIRGVSLAGGWYPSMRWGRPPCGQTDTSKNITLATTSLRSVINSCIANLIHRVLLYRATPTTWAYPEINYYPQVSALWSV